VWEGTSPSFCFSATLPPSFSLHESLPQPEVASRRLADGGGPSDGSLLLARGHAPTLVPPKTSTACSMTFAWENRAHGRRCFANSTPAKKHPGQRAHGLWVTYDADKHLLRRRCHDAGAPAGIAATYAARAVNGSMMSSASIQHVSPERAMVLISGARGRRKTRQPHPDQGGGQRPVGRPCWPGA